MKKNKSFFAVSLLLMAMSISACSLLPNQVSKPSRNDPTESSQPAESEVQLPEAFKIYQLYLASGGKLSYEEWLESVKGEKGDPGHTPVVTIGDTLKVKKVMKVIKVIPVIKAIPAIKAIPVNPLMNYIKKPILNTIKAKKNGLMIY